MSLKFIDFNQQKVKIQSETKWFAAAGHDACFDTAKDAEQASGLTGPAYIYPISVEFIDFNQQRIEVQSETKCFAVAGQDACFDTVKDAEQASGLTGPAYIYPISVEFIEM